MNVSEALVELLHRQGVERIYGIPGDAINAVMEAVRKHPSVDFIPVKHEEGGALAASIEAKLTQKLTAVVGTSGPGAIHLLNGLYDARLDHAPVIAITGQVERSLLGTDAHQEVGLSRLFGDVAEYSQTLSAPDQIPDVVLEACRAARYHQGVAHLALPSDLAGLKVQALPDIAETVPVPPVAGEPNSQALADVARLIEQHEKPCILAGIGCRDARHELLEFAQHLKAPIVRTLRAKDVIDDDHPLCIGGVGLLGTPAAMEAFDDCDLLILVGADFPYKAFYPENTTLIQIDRDPGQIGKRHPSCQGLAGDAGICLTRLKGALEERHDDRFLHQCQQKHSNWKTKQFQKLDEDHHPIRAAHLIHEISRRAPEDAIFVTDTGTSTAWTARFLTVSERQRYTLSSALGTMGVALPGAIGAQLAYPERPVIAIAGDGGFTMTMAELKTAQHLKLPIKTVILNNQQLGFIKLEQEAAGLPNFGTDLDNIDFIAFAQACGVEAIRVQEQDELDDALDKLMGASGPMILDVQVDPEELIMPPKIEAEQAWNFAKAKLKQWLEA